MLLQMPVPCTACQHRSPPFSGPAPALCSSPAMKHLANTWANAQSCTGGSSRCQQCSAATNTLVTQHFNLQVVFVNAIAALPDSLDFRAGFLEALRPFYSRLSGAAGIQQAILASVARDFAESERAHDVLAREAAWAAEPDAALQVRWVSLQ